ncbi:TerB family tellurite resistance protein [Gluconobacter sphaericus]|uniref:J domain-containing protein n=1 Tax=Gluconobacter sphaericus NBRC 12467 TaxID=1307951 RepID=A0AA37WB86_9PROT|nr:TerB family tellurite resistance protein [Gluconobacter sphaericus]MBF0886513.1 DnaJ domain-containing protein [Gluconobacter sphaericus]MBS1086592.1 TerB family tellurite resistance protein [Gluconobacter sphaericus]MBS1100512.1 TerB family tellurite resistance protein [Gluconobacter sphaericus]QQX90240.1 TerB family tellurite resistance protein [Gluconobacter sphaericus]GBR52096.1 molecular chaperone DnaJ [Gluconobacter sphaericus NBRC 12467]
MAIWGKMFGGVAGFAVGGPFGALMGAALGHAADNGSLLKPSTGGWSERFPANGRPDPNSAAFFGAAKIAAALGKRDQLYAIGLVALCAKLAKIDGPVNRHEINAFKTCFQFPPDNTKEVGMLFDRARDRTDDFEMYAREMGKAYADNTAPLENLMTALFRIARADAGPSRELHPKEIDFLQRVHGAFGLPPGAWDRAESGNNRAASGNEPDAYRILGITRSATDTEIRVRWRTLIREHHPDVLAQKPMSETERKRAQDRVARINAAWDRIKRDRQL